MSEFCCVEECLNPATRAGLCWAHAKRKRLHGDVRAVKPIARRGMTGMEALMEAALKFLEVKPTDKRGWLLAKKTLRMAAIRYRDSRRHRVRAVGEHRK